MTPAQRNHLRSLMARGLLFPDAREHARMMCEIDARGIASPPIAVAVATTKQSRGELVRLVAAYIGIAISLAAALGLLDGPIAALWGARG